MFTSKCLKIWIVYVVQVQKDKMHNGILFLDMKLNQVNAITIEKTE